MAATGYKHIQGFQTSLLLIFLFLITGCKQSDNIRIVFAFGADDKGSVSRLVSHFNETNEENITVEFRLGQRLSNDFFDELSVDFSVGGSDIDIWGADVVWTAHFASRGWAADLTERFREELSDGAFAEVPLRSAMYQDRVWGVPWFTEAGFLYYRKDLLNAHGIADPPDTWSQLFQICHEIRATNPQIDIGFLFQADAYEGGVVNACEFIWNAGGTLLTGDQEMSFPDASHSNVESERTKQGLSVATQLVREGISPRKIVNYRELECLEHFMGGNVLFMRGWPAIRGEFLKPGAKVNADMIGISSLPTLSQELQSKSCLGGWNLMINSGISDRKKEAAWKFMLYLTSREAQLSRLKEVGVLPTLKILYEDRTLIEELPFLEEAYQIIQHSQNRPITPYYMEVSPFIATVFQSVVRGTLTPENALRDLQVHLERILKSEPL